MEIIRGFANLPKITLSTCGRDDDVFIDRLNYKYTTSILFVSSLTITVKILQSDHIQCWVPAILAKYEHYINVYCWISNTYFVSFREQTTSVTNKTERTVKYYQWVPMILLCMAFFFLLPRFFYRFLSKQSGVDMLNMADAALNYMAVEKFEKRRRSLLYLANTLHFYSICNKTKRTKGGFGSSSAASLPAGMTTRPALYKTLCCQGKANGAYLTCVFIAAKLLYIANAIGQLFLLNVFLGFNYNSHGFHVLRDMTTGLISNTNAISAQRRAEAERSAQAFAASLNLHKSPMNGFPMHGSGVPGGAPPASFVGPSVIFDTSDDDVPSPGTGGGMFSGGQMGINGVNLGGSANGYGSLGGGNGLDGGSGTFPETQTTMNKYFPRESACDFRIRANIDSLVHNYTVQCVLPINLYNEQLFILLWAWLWLVCMANGYDLIVWLFRLMPGSRYEYVRSRIRLRNNDVSVKRNLDSFVFDYLTFDGVFMLRIMSASMSDCVTHEVLQTLWHNYNEQALGSGGGGGSAGGSGSGGHSAAGRRAGASGSAAGSANMRAKYSQRYSSSTNGGGGGHDESGGTGYVSHYIENI